MHPTASPVVPATPAGHTDLPSPQPAINFELGINTPHGTTDPNVPHTPNDLAAAHTTKVPPSSVSSKAADHADDVESRVGDIVHKASRSFQDSAHGNNDPFVTSSNNSSEPTPYRPRPDRFGTEITAELAQAIFPSDACVFVANLVASKTDDEIRDSVKEIFAPFGTCYVKVKRDSGGMPYAFVQYEKVADSSQAIIKGRHLSILGRPCRTERAKVNRSLYLSRTTGGPISETQAREILADMGDIQSVWYSTPTDIEMFRLPQGIWIQFAFFQDARDAAAAFKESTEFRLEQPQLPDDLRAKLTTTRSSATPHKTPIRQGPCNTPASRSSWNPDATSVFIGNLNGNVTLDQLRGVFGKFGSIRNIDIVCRPNVAGNNVHAFVDYDSPRAAERALNAEHVLGDTHLRVERRQSTPFSIVRSSSSRFSNGSPRRRSYASSSSSNMPATPYNGGIFPPEFGHRSHGGEPFSMHHNMQSFLPSPYGPAPHVNVAPVHTPNHSMMFNNTGCGPYPGDHGFGSLGFHHQAPPHFALPHQMLPVPVFQGETKDGILPTVHEQ